MAEHQYDLEHVPWRRMTIHGEANDIDRAVAYTSELLEVIGHERDTQCESWKTIERENERETRAIRGKLIPERDDENTWKL